MENKRGESMSEIIGKVIKELEHVFDVLSASIKNNRERIAVLERRIQELERK
jgi:polyhydroxyalkanoate synthesis regulator phasin